MLFYHDCQNGEHANIAIYILGLRPRTQESKIRLTQSCTNASEPKMPTILKQWLDFKPKSDSSSPSKDPTEHEKGKFLKFNHTL